MLVLSRKPGERIQIGCRIVVTVLASRNGRVRLGIEAPTDIDICREELVGAREQSAGNWRKEVAGDV